jgi:hypothetical protein
MNIFPVIATSFPQIIDCLMKGQAVNIDAGGGKSAKHIGWIKEHTLFIMRGNGTDPAQYPFDIIDNPTTGPMKHGSYTYLIQFAPAFHSNKEAKRLLRRKI